MQTRKLTSFYRSYISLSHNWGWFKFILFVIKKSGKRRISKPQGLVPDSLIEAMASDMNNMGFNLIIALCICITS